MNLAVAAYPDISSDDYDRIQAFRKRHDKLYFDMIEPHFTFVFPVSGIEEKVFVKEIQELADGFPPFEFCIRCAVLNKDAFIDTFHALLVPDEGYSQIVKLHDRLYARRLFQYRKLEIDFIPHLGVGNSRDPLKCLEMIEHWNQTDLTIPGKISVLDIVRLENDLVETILRIPLSG